MPITVPRASVTEAADDLKARDAMLRQFPEVEQVVGKAGRAETPTDPAPLEMVETIVNLRPKEYWPKRLLRYPDAMAQAGVVLAALENRDLIKTPDDKVARQGIINDATMAASGRLDATLRTFVLGRYAEFQQRLAPQLTREFVARLIDAWRRSGQLLKPVDDAEIDRLTEKLAKRFGPVLAAGPAQDDVNQLISHLAEALGKEKHIDSAIPRSWRCLAMLCKKRWPGWGSNWASNRKRCSRLCSLSYNSAAKPPGATWSAS